MEYNVPNFKTLYGLSGSSFPTNTTELITEATFRQFGEDIADSFNNPATAPPIRFGGLYSFPGGVFPTATKAGTLYIATADKGSPGDPDYVQTGTWFVSTVDGANTYAQFSYKP